VFQCASMTKEIPNTLFTAGIDEAGRGPLAGPVTAACIVLPADFHDSRVGDSKQLSESRREELFPELCRAAVAYSVVAVGARRIEAVNIRNATKLAMQFAAERVYRRLCRISPGAKLHLLIDGNMKIETAHSQETIIKGDAKVPLIGAASILAKVTRDRLMLLLAERYPGYGFAEHKGYPTPYHRAQVAALGPCCVHRRTFAGVVEYLPPTASGDAPDGVRSGMFGVELSSPEKF
jgi:ribonuclease HII